jgi:hypothetical protein
MREATGARSQVAADVAIDLLEDGSSSTPSATPWLRRRANLPHRHSSSPNASDGPKHSSQNSQRPSSSSFHRQAKSSIAEPASSSCSVGRKTSLSMQTLFLLLKVRVVHAACVHRLIQRNEDEDRENFRWTFTESLRSGQDLFTYARFKLDQPPPIDANSKTGLLFEVKGHPHYAQGHQEPQCFFLTAMPYPSRNISM